MLIIRWTAVVAATLVLVLVALGLPGSLSSQAAAQPDGRTPGSDCSATPPRGILRAEITEHAATTEARFTNRSQTCSYPIGLAVYRDLDGNIDHQQLYDYRLAVIPPHSTLTLTVNNPSCQFQSDAFYGSLITSFAGGVRYDKRRLADDAGNAGQSCAVYPTATPTGTPVPPTATPTLPPPPGTMSPAKLQARKAP